MRALTTTGLWRDISRFFSKRSMTCLFAAAFLLSLNIVSAETFRVRQTHVADMRKEVSVHTAQLGFNDALAITLPDETQFLKGIELEFKLPSDMLVYKHCIGFSFYTNVSPVPDENTFDFTGKRIYINTLPARLSMVLQIPFSENHSIEETPYATLMPYSIVEGSSTVFLRLQPITKLLPENVEDLVFEVSVKPLFSDEGVFELSLVYPDKEHKGIAVFIDEKPVTNYEKPIKLAAGMHYLAVTSEHYRTEVRTFAIDQAKTTKLEVQLRDTSPSLVITAPENASVFIDGVPASWGDKPITVQPGEHTVKFVIGDYEVSKAVTAINGKTYNISVSFDVQITETP